MSGNKVLNKKLIEAIRNGKEPEVGDVVLYIGPKKKLRGLWQVDGETEDKLVPCVVAETNGIGLEYIPQKQLSRAIPKSLMAQCELYLGNT